MRIIQGPSDKHKYVSRLYSADETHLPGSFEPLAYLWHLFGSDTHWWGLYHRHLWERRQDDLLWVEVGQVSRRLCCWVLGEAFAAPGT